MGYQQSLEWSEKVSTCRWGQPTGYVSWHDVTAYAKWSGKRLPIGKEWEFAARGRLKNEEYSWGEDEFLVRDDANYDGTGGKNKWKSTVFDCCRPALIASEPHKVHPCYGSAILTVAATIAP